MQQSIGTPVGKMPKPKTVDAYIAAAPSAMRGKLKELRALIRAVAPGAEERISYGMPYYGYRGRLVYFRLWKNHVGLYIPPPVIEEHKRELARYETARATVRFPLDRRLPVGLIRKLIKARRRKNEAGKRK
jgi:uncharacterized protein YdhG (YjbR/CyaY superfamily)